VKRERRYSLRVALPLVALLLLGTPLEPSRAAEPPETIDASASCVSGECHSEALEYGELHWSDFAGVGECQKCHEPEEDLHAFTIDDPPGLCVGCHEEIGEQIESEKTVHDPAEDCTDCHDPHGAEFASLLREIKEEDDLTPLCFECHDEEIIADEYTHGPAEQGECTLCHSPHASSKRALLLAEGVELCGDCHDDVAEEIESSEYVHDPVEEGCADCHNPHSGPSPGMLQAEKRQLCGECHDDVVAEAENAAVDHAPTVTKDECLNCHSPHASNNPANLLKNQRDLCLECHNRPLESGDSTLVDMQELLLQNQEWHEPIREENCTGCHQPHGSANFRILKEPFPPRFYADFDPELYALCFSCHEELAVTVQWTRTLTGFRDGDRNLHFLHVNKARRGRSCRACHEVHASPNPLHIRQEVPYGKWMMPIDFEKKKEGGSCHPGCHRIEIYDRDADDYREER
jgi:predicted CXXCH cytochrome family protein